MASRYAYVKAWRQRHPGCRILEARKRYSRKHEYILSYKKRWRRMNIDRCRQVEAAYAREYRQRDANKTRIKRFKEKQRLLLVELAGRPRSPRCELCLATGLTVFDHDHATGKFRGWLCQRCNRTLGQVKDDVALLLKMADYITKGGMGYGPVKLSSSQETAEVILRNSE